MRVLTEVEIQRVWQRCFDEASDMSTKEVAHMIFDRMSNEEKVEMIVEIEEEIAEDLRLDEELKAELEDGF